MTKDRFYDGPPGSKDNSPELEGVVLFSLAENGDWTENRIQAYRFDKKGYGVAVEFFKYRLGGIWYIHEFRSSLIVQMTSKTIFNFENDTLTESFKTVKDFTNFLYRINERIESRKEKTGHSYPLYPYPKAEFEVQIY